MTRMFKLLAATFAAVAIAGGAMAGGLCGGMKQEASMPTETVATDTGAPMTVADSGAVSTE